MSITKDYFLSGKPFKIDDLHGVYTLGFVVLANQKEGGVVSMRHSEKEPAVFECAVEVLPDGNGFSFHTRVFRCKIEGSIMFKSCHPVAAVTAKTQLQDPKNPTPNTTPLK